MTSEQGCFTLSAPQKATGSVLVTPAVVPVEGTAKARKTIGGRVIELPLAATIVGSDVSIDVRRGHVGSMICWTAYSG